MKSKSPLKCIIAILLVAMMMISGFTLAFAEEETVSGFSFSTSLDTSGRTIDLIINLDENSGIQCAEYALQYDLEKLKLVNFESGEMFPGDWTIEYTNGVWNPQLLSKFKTVWVMSSNDSSKPLNMETGLFAKYSFELTPAAELGDVLEIKVVDMEGGREIPKDPDNVYGSILVENNGTYTVTGYNVTGTITTPATSSTTKPLEGALVEILDGDTVIKSAITDENGAFSIPAVPGGEYLIRITQTPYAMVNESIMIPSISESTDYNIALIGDINMDGRINAQDRQILARYLAGWDGYAERILFRDAADINRDGRVNAQDRQILARYLAGWGEQYNKYFS